MIEQNPMLIPLLLMAIAAPIGAFDVIYYHLYKFRLYRRPESRKETITHLLRGLLFASAAVMIFLFEPRGFYFWLVGGLFLLDFVNSVVDAWLEPDSRRSLGGLPPYEYMVHIIGATFAGAITLAYFILGWQWQFDPAQLAPGLYMNLPVWLKWQAYFALVGTYALTFVESFLFLKHFQKGWR